MHHSDFISILASIYKPLVYLELGIYDGETFKKVLPFCKQAIGVDSKPVKIDGEIYNETTDSFFSHFNKNVDMVFIDADHSYIQAKKDLENSYKLLNSGGVILMHDVDPESDTLFKKECCGDSYKIIELVENGFLNLNIYTIPIAEGGLSILTKKCDTRVYRRQ